MTTGGEGVRFCRNCSQYLPVHLFPKGPIRYLCKQHWIEQVCACTKRHRLQQKAKKLIQVQANQEKKKKGKAIPVLQAILNQCKRDMRSVFKKDPAQYLKLSETDISELTGQHEYATESENEGPWILPKNPDLPWSAENSVVCSRLEEREIALSFWKMHPCFARYQTLMGLLDKNN